MSMWQLAHCASLVGRQPPISYIYRGGVTTLRTREWSLNSSPSRHGVHRMHGLDGAAGHCIETCRLCACTAQPLLPAKTTAGATVGMLDVDAILPGGLRYTFDDGGCDHRPDPLPRALPL